MESEMRKNERGKGGKIRGEKEKKKRKIEENGENKG